MSATVLARKSLSLRAVNLLMLLIVLPFITSCEKQRTIVNGLDEKEANEIIVLLSTKGVDAEKVKSMTGQGGGGQAVILWDIAVPEEESTSAMSILNNAGLPRRKSQNLLNIFSNTGLVPTDLAEKIKYQAGLAEQIASTIRNIDGVLDADVLISFPKEDPLNPTGPKKDITASIYVKHSGVLDDPNTHLASKIKNLVTSSVSGLKYENVTLVPDRARFTDIPLGGVGEGSEEKQFVRLWTVAVAEESVTRFRIIFFSFTMLTLILILAMVWVVWKTFPLIQERGGVKELFTLRPMAKKEKRRREKSPVGGPSSEEDEELFGKESYREEGVDFGGDIDVSEEER